MTPRRILPPLLAAAFLWTAAPLPAREGGGPGFAVSGAPPGRLAAGGRIAVTVRVTNTGSSPWPSGRPFRLAYHWLGPDGKPVVWDGERTPLPLPVPPGASVEVEAHVVAPARAGRYGFQWDVVEEGVRWLGRAMVPAPPVVPVEVLGPALPPSFEAESAGPWVMAAGGRRRVRVTVRNTGSSSWPAGRPIHLAYHWLDPEGRMVVRDGLRTGLPLPVPPGGAVTVQARVSAPERGGLLRLQWDVVEERVCWFSQRMRSPPPSRPVLVVPLWPLAMALVALLAGFAAWRAGGVAPHRPSPLALADLVWLAASLLVKQAWVISQAGPLPGGGSPVTAASMAMVVVACLLLVPQRVRPWAAWLVGVLFGLVMWGDVLYLRYFQDLPSFALLGAARQTGRVTGSIRALIHGGDLWVLADLVPAGVLAGRAGRLRPGRLLRRAATALCLAAVLPAAAWVVHASRAVKGGDVQRFSSLQTAERVGVVGYHLVDGWDRVKEAVWGATVSEADVRRVRGLLQRRRPLRAGDGPLFGAERGADVILLQVESLQGFVVGLRVGGREVTPTLNRLAREGVYVSRCTDQTAYGRTSDAELLSETTLLPAERGAACFSYGADHFVGLARVLGERGYTTLSAVPFAGRFWNRRTTHPAFGFAVNLFARDFEPGRVIGWGLNDRDFLAQAAARLEHLQEPFLAYLITLSLHHPFEGFPRDLEELDVGEWEGTPFGGYLHAMHFFDTALAGFLGELERAGLADRTILVIWGDHDAGFPWTAELAQVVGVRPRELDFFLEDRVPLIFVLPPSAGVSGVRIQSPAGLWDVAPTVAALLGVDPGPLPWLGRNLAVAAGRGPVVRPRGSWIGPRLLWTGVDGGHCYDWTAGKVLPAEACAEGSRRAAAIAAASELILKADLGVRLRREAEP